MEYSPQLDKQPVSFLLPLRHSKVYSASSLQKTLNLEHNKIEPELSKSSISIIENKTPISSTISHLQTVSVYLHRYGCTLINLLFCLISLHPGIFRSISVNFSFSLVGTIVFTDIH